MAEKLYYSMGEVTEMLDVNPSLIRYWGTQFELLRPHRNKKGNRMFTSADVETLKLIYHLLKEQGLTIAGAKKALRQRRTTDSELSRRMQLIEHLQQIRSMLVEVRDGMDEEGLLVNDEEESCADAAADSEKGAASAVAEIQPQQPKVEPAAESPVEVKRLPFYEQTLFNMDEF